MNLVATDWRTLSAAAQIRHLEVEGYVVLPDALGRDALEELRRETRQLPTQPSTYHELQGSAAPSSFFSTAVTATTSRAPSA